MDYPDKLDLADLLMMQLHSALEALAREQLQSLDLQQQNINITQALLDERRTRLKQKCTEAEQRLQMGVAVLESRYGVEHETQVDWETGIIQRPA